jgi:hypothetical protein
LAIWALWLLRKKEVRAAFGQKETEFVIPPKIRNITVSAVRDARIVYGRGKAEVQKIIRETDTDSQKPPKKVVNGQNSSLTMAIASFALGILSIIILSLGASNPVIFAFGFLCLFFAGFLGVTVIRKIKDYRKHLVETGFAAVGILIALVLAIWLLFLG